MRLRKEEGQPSITKVRNYKRRDEIDTHTRGLYIWYWKDDGSHIMASIFSIKEEERSSAQLEPLKRTEKGSNNPCEEQDKGLITETVRQLGSSEAHLSV